MIIGTVKHKLKTFFGCCNAEPEKQNRYSNHFFFCVGNHCEVAQASNPYLLTILKCCAMCEKIDAEMLL